MRFALRNSSSDTAYILFYRRIDARASPVPLVRAATRAGQIDAPKTPLDSKSDVKSPKSVGDVKSNPNSAPPEEPERDPNPNATAKPASGDNKSAPAATTATAALAAAAKKAMVQPPNRVAASLTELMRVDNTRYLEELSASTTVHYLQHINANVRSQARLTSDWLIQTPAQAAAAAAAAAAQAAPTVCAVCRGMAHSGGVSNCPYNGLVVQTCPDCHLQIAKSAYANHFITPPAAPGTTPDPAAPKQCINRIAWGDQITLPEAEDAAGSGGSGGSGSAGGPPATPGLVRAASVFSCGTCGAVIVGMEAYAKHLGNGRC